MSVRKLAKAAALRVTWNTIMYFTVCACTSALTRSFTNDLHDSWSRYPDRPIGAVLPALELVATAIAIIVAIWARLRQLRWPLWLVVPVFALSFGGSVYLTVSLNVGGGRIVALAYLLPHLPLLLGVPVENPGSREGASCP
jgi:cytochrome bd-type quinol oxidase subunit 2